ncbi:MAG: hypothetical protein CSA62_07885 [Planctomycetota bacterium]|nr:MAG: hypothetical protein CSA62_07885 [Planctomycetota bacterium]
MTEQERPDENAALQNPAEAPAPSEGASQADAPKSPEDAEASAKAAQPESGSASEQGAEQVAGQGKKPKADGEKKPRKRRRKKRPASEASEAAPKPRGKAKAPEEQVREAMSLLASAYLELRKRAGGLAPKSREESPVLELEVPVPLRRNDLSDTAKRFTSALRDRLERNVVEAGLLVPGRTWCFDKGSFDAPYARPDDPRQVLVGYGLEGRPRFADLVTLAIERKHESVDEFLAGREGAVSFLEKGSVVTEGLTPAFDPAASPHPLVGQAMMGLFESGEEGRRVALTVQVVRRDDGDGKLRLLAHPVCAVDLFDLPEFGVVRHLRRFQQDLDALGQRLAGRQAAGEDFDLEEEVLSELRDLVRRLGTTAKNRERKTDHSREREGQRPTQLAFPEARSARDHHLFVDTEEQTIVVIGRKGRVHVFSPDGRHVTSVVMPPPNVRQRQKSGRWRAAEPEERGNFREAIEQKKEDEAAGSE